MRRAWNSNRQRPAVSAWKGILAFGALAVGLSACGGGSGAPATTTSSTTLPPLPPKEIAYVALAGSGGNIGFGTSMVEVNVSPGTEAVGARTRVGSYPDAVAVTPNGRLVLVANYTSNTVTPILEPNGTALPAVPAGPGPAGIAITPDGKTAYVTDDGSLSSLDNKVTPIDLVTLKPEKAITVGAGPQGIAITPDGSKAFVADAGAVIQGQPGGIGDQVTPIDLTTRRSQAPIKVGNGPLGVAITPDGTTAFVTNLNSESVTPISVGSNIAGASIPVAGGPVAVVVAARNAWVVNAPANGQPGNNVQPIGISSDLAGTPIRVSRGAQAIAVAPGGTTAWVACLNSDEIVPLDLQTHRAGALIRVLGGPFALAVADQPQTPTPPPTTAPAGTKKKKPASGASSTNMTKG